VLEFYPSGFYNIKKNGNGYQLKFPDTVDNFITDMDRYGVQLYWTSWIDENFEPKEYLHKDEIRAYFTDLLTKMKKSHELQ